MIRKEQEICNWIDGIELSGRAKRMVDDTEMSVLAGWFEKFYDSEDSAGMAEAADEIAEQLGF